MTPAATTPAGKGATQTRKGGGGVARPGQKVPGHRRTVASPSAPRARRVSGPVGGRLAPPPRPAAKPARRSPAVPRLPRRVSGPAPRREPLGARCVACLRSLPDHRWLDRLVRGRTWIGVLGLMLAGIVFMQVEVLKYGASMGRAIDRGTQLQGRNESLRASVAALADDQRIERLAAARGMVMPAPSDVGFLAPSGAATVARALAAIHAPSPSSFLTATRSNGGVVLSNGSDTAAGATTASAATPSASAASLAGATSSGSAAHP